MIEKQDEDKKNLKLILGSIKQEIAKIDGAFEVGEEARSQSDFIFKSIYMVNLCLNQLFNQMDFQQAPYLEGIRESVMILQSIIKKLHQRNFQLSNYIQYVGSKNVVSDFNTQVKRLTQKYNEYEFLNVRPREHARVNKREKLEKLVSLPSQILDEFQVNYDLKYPTN